MHLPLINPLSPRVRHCVHSHMLVCRQQCMYGYLSLRVCEDVGPAPRGGEMVEWSGLGAWWCDSAGAEQGQSVQLHLWPFCSFTTWPLTVFRCYMTRISEPRPFRAASAADSVYTEVSLVIGMCMKWLTPPAKGQMTVGHRSPYVCVWVRMGVWMKLKGGFVEALIHTWHCANEGKKLSLHSANLGVISQSQPIRWGEEKEKIKHLLHFPNWP